MAARSSSEGTATLDKALDVLDAVGGSAQGLSQAELAARLALPRTTLYRLLATLVARGLLRRDPLRRVYCLGLRCFEYARQAYAMPDLVAAASGELRALRDLTGETTYLAVLDGLDTLSLERVDGAHAQRSQSALGQRKPLHCTSQGKAMLAALPAERRDALVREISLPALTPHTLTDRRRLQADLRVTAARGYSIDDEEIALGVRCCGAAIVDAAGEMRGAISVAGPAFRLTRARIELLGPELAHAARRIGAQLSANTVRPADGAARVVDGPWAFRGAFPRWHAASGRLFWADRLGPSVQVCDGRADQWLSAAEAPIDLLLLHGDGVALAAGGRWWHLDAGAAPQAMPLPPAPPLGAACVHPGGALWSALADGGRWRVGEVRADGTLQGPDWCLSWHLPDAPGAMAWDASGNQLFAITPDSGDIFRWTAGDTSVRRLATVPKGSGRLSGLALDQAGGLWSALHDGWGVVRFGDDGALDRVLPLPVPTPTDLAFGGADLKTLFVTSAREPVTREALASAPLSGRLFSVRVDEAGVAAPAWRGFGG